MSSECNILNISALGLFAQSISFSTDVTIHKLPSLLYTSQVYFFKYGLKSFFSLVTNWKELTYNKRKWHSNMNPQSVKCHTHSQQLPHVSCGAGALIKGCFAPVLVVKGRLHKALGPISARQLCYMCMPMRPNKAETAVHGCHYLGQEPAYVIWLCVCQTVGWCLSVSLAFIVRKVSPFL